MKKGKSRLFDQVTQVLLPGLTITAFALTALKKPELGLIVNLASQIFWLYSGWQAWKKAGQIGIFATSVVITLIVSYGIVNYWFFN